MCSPGGLLDFENEEYVVFYLLSGQGPASSLDCPVIDILEFLSTGNELQLLTLGPIYLLPQNHLTFNFPVTHLPFTLDMTSSASSVLGLSLSAGSAQAAGP